MSPIFKTCSILSLFFGIQPRSTDSKTKDLERTVVVKISCFCSMPYNPNCRIVKKLVIFFHTFKLIFFSYRLHFFRQSFNKFSQTVETFSMENCRFCSLLWETDCPFFQICVFRFTHLDFQTPNSHYPQACIFHFDLRWKTETWGDRLLSQNNDVFLASVSRKSDNSQSCF